MNFNPLAHTWYGSLPYFVAYALVYGLIGAYIGGRLDDRYGESTADAIPNSVWGVGFWPLILVYHALAIVGNLPYKMGRSYSARKAERTGVPAPERPVTGKVVPQTIRIAPVDMPPRRTQTDMDYDYYRH